MLFFRFGWTVSGKSQLVGKCVDATHEGWNNPVPITDRLEEYHKETGLVFTELRYGECGIVAPDFVRGFTCWDVESGKFIFRVVRNT